jgi:hypothetical protein
LERSENRIEGCELSRICRLSRTLRYALKKIRATQDAYLFISNNVLGVFHLLKQPSFRSQTEFGNEKNPELET